MNSSTLKGPGLDLLDFQETMSEVATRQHELNLGGTVEIQLGNDGYESGTVYLEVADVLISAQSGRVVIVAGKRVSR